MGPRTAKAFLRYYQAHLEASIEELTFRAYVAESVRLMGQGKAPVKSWIDIARPKGADFDAQQVIDSLVSRLGESNGPA